jgi:hypothetical protein
MANKRRIMLSALPKPLPHFTVLEPVPTARRPLSTGSPTVDEISGGIPRATLSEIAGNASSGRTGLMWSLLCRATAAGEFCVLVDVQDTFDPASAVAAGIQLARLLWVRCAGNLEHALKSADLLTRAGGFGVVVIDLSGTPDRLTRRIPIASWFRLRHGAEHSGAALVVVSERIQAGSCAGVQLEINREQSLWSAKLLHGIAASAGLRKRSQLRAASFIVTR